VTPELKALAEVVSEAMDQMAWVGEPVEFTPGETTIVVDGDIHLEKLERALIARGWVRT
jgi:hypothetical protein